MRPLLAPLVSLFALVAATACLAGTPSGYDAPDAASFERFLARDDHRRAFNDFVQLLAERGVDDVVEPWTLWRQGTDWRSLDEPPFAAPPAAMWPEIVPTLALLRDEVVPLVGPVEVVSGFRTERYNARAGGSKGSRHKGFEAVDVVPRRSWSRTALHEALLGLWSGHGPARKMGLGLYGGTRFHVDTWKHRRW